jgi:hypothetical protein
LGAPAKAVSFGHFFAASQRNGLAEGIEKRKKKKKQKKLPTKIRYIRRGQHASFSLESSILDM